MDPVLHKIIREYEFALKWYDGRENWARWLQNRGTDELQLVLDNWQRPERQIQKRLLDEELDRRRPTLLEAMAERQKGSRGGATRARKALRHSSGQVDPTLGHASQPKREQPAGAADRPSWWLEHKNQVYVGLLVGVPGSIIGILALIFSG